MAEPIPQTNPADNNKGKIELRMIHNPVVMKTEPVFLFIVIKETLKQSTLVPFHSISSDIQIAANSSEQTGYF